MSQLISKTDCIKKKKNNLSKVSKMFSNIKTWILHDTYLKRHNTFFRILLSNTLFIGWMLQKHKLYSHLFIASMHQTTPLSRSTAVALYSQVHERNTNCITFVVAFMPSSCTHLLIHYAASF